MKDHRIHNIFYIASIVSIIVLCIYFIKNDKNIKHDSSYDPQLNINTSDIRHSSETDDIKEETSIDIKKGSEMSESEEKQTKEYSVKDSAETENHMEQGEVSKAILSDEKIAELEKEKKSWQELYPTARISWFQIECHDGKEHFYYTTEGMPFDAWLASLYNVDGWKKVGDLIVSPDESVYLLCFDSIGGYQLSNGILFNTATYHENIARIKQLMKHTGKNARDFVRHSPFGFQSNPDGFTFMDIDYDKEAAIYTDYKFDDEHNLSGLTTTYYCTDDNIDYFLELVTKSKDIASYSKYGDCIFCEYTESYIQSLQNMSELEITESLDAIFTEKADMDFD